MASSHVADAPDVSKEQESESWMPSRSTTPASGAGMKGSAFPSLPEDTPHPNSTDVICE